MKFWVHCLIFWTLAASGAAGAAEPAPESAGSPAFGLLDELLESEIAGLPPAVRAKADRPEVKEKLKAYLNQLKIENHQKLSEEVIKRLFQSSTQFLLCGDMENWECLEKKPEITPTVDFRQETQEDLGKPVMVNEDLKIESFFTERWSRRLRGQEINAWTVASTLGKKILDFAKDGLYMAIYGIDDIDETMKPVFDAVQTKVRNGVETKAVVDVTQEGSSNSFLRTYDVELGENGPEIKPLQILDLNFSYIAPEDQHLWVWGRPFWMDKVVEEKPDLSLLPKNRYSEDLQWLMEKPAGQDAIRMTFEYKETLNLLKLINQGIRSDEESKGRIEFPMEGIMHNKFVVFKNGDKKSVWSGTTNVSMTCMGDERNSNMAIFIDNTAVADTFLTEFQEMHSYDSDNTKLAAKAPTLITGRFHDMKRPNTKRYFKFKDGHELRVHFSPTDDGEHRAILPMIYSARKGDQIRISMFGAGGIEIIRALQMAAARGVKIQIVLDSFTGSQRQGWIKNPEGNLLQPNPYVAPGQNSDIEVRLSQMKDGGKNHQKTASLTRANGRVEQLIVGSQNWSVSGNDISDENMVTIRNRLGNLKAGEEFNQNFDQEMFPLAVKVILNSSGKVEKQKN